METIKNLWFENGRIFMLSSEDKIYSRPLEAFPALKDSSDRERMNYTLEMRGQAVRWKDLDEDIHISSFYERKEPERLNEVSLLFNKFPQLDVAEIARSMGIHKSLLAKYIYGIEKPSEHRLEQLKEILRALGNELAAV